MFKKDLSVQTEETEERKKLYDEVKKIYQNLEVADILKLKDYINKLHK